MAGSVGFSLDTTAGPGGGPARLARGPHLAADQREVSRCSRVFAAEQDGIGGFVPPRLPGWIVVTERYPEMVRDLEPRVVGDVHPVVADLVLVDERVIAEVTSPVPDVVLRVRIVGMTVRDPCFRS